MVDLLCRPVNLARPIGDRVLYETDPVVLTGGGITINSGVTLARLGVGVGVFSYVGRDAWAPIVHHLLRDEGVDDELLIAHPTAATSTTVVAIDKSGERCFFHSVGAPKLLDASAFYDRLDALGRSRFILLGYYSLLPHLEPDLHDVLARLRARGCRTALDAAGDGGAMQPLDRILPQLDVYVPSLAEARHQTGEDDPRRIIEAYRGCAAPGILGVKLGVDGVLLSPTPGEFVDIPIVEPPGKVIDTTGAGDSFFAGLLAGMIRGLDIESAGRLGAAAAGCCVTSVGGSTGGRDYEFTARLAGIA